MSKQAQDVRGFSDQPQMMLIAAPSVSPARSGAEPANAVTLRLGPGGRVVIPAEMREAMGLKQGDAMLATLDKGELKLVTLLNRVLELQALTKAHVPDNVSLADDLLADRRAEAVGDAEG